LADIDKKINIATTNNTKILNKVARKTTNGRLQECHSTTGWRFERL